MLSIGHVLLLSGAEVNPFPLLLLLFLLVPLVEIYFLILVGGWIGALPTVLLVVLTAVLGALLLRWQGLATIQKVQLMLSRGQVPAAEMLEGALLLAGGALLLTPGFVTDLLGFSVLVPGLRHRIAVWLLGRMMSGPGPGGRPPGTPGGGHITIEGDYRREDD